MTNRDIGPHFHPHTHKLGTGELSREEEAELIAYTHGRPYRLEDYPVQESKFTETTQDPAIRAEIRRLEQQNRARLNETLQNSKPQSPRQESSTSNAVREQKLLKL